MEERIRQAMYLETLEIKCDFLKLIMLEEAKQLTAHLETYLIKAGFDPS